MLQLFGFDRIGVVVGDLYFVDPDPEPGQESPERGVRLEVRALEQGTAEGSIYASRPITVATPIWRADLLESVDGPPGSFDRTHHHPRFQGWEPGRRTFDVELSAAPLAWLAEALGDLDLLIERSGLAPDTAGPDDAEQLRAAVPEIIECVDRMLGRVHRGELAVAPEESADSVRIGWL